MAHYVCMTDSFMSGWGLAQGKTNRLAIIVGTYDQACKMFDWVKGERSEMKRVTICANAPREREGQFLQFKTADDMPMWFRKAGITHD